MQTVELYYKNDETDFNSLILAAKDRATGECRIILIPESCKQQLKFGFEKKPSQPDEFWFQK